jgi:hypothetical protein
MTEFLPLCDFKYENYYNYCSKITDLHEIIQTTDSGKLEVEEYLGVFIVLSIGKKLSKNG